MTEWICKEVQMIRQGDGAAVGVCLERKKELIRCKECIHWDKGHTEECDNLDSVCFHNGWCKPDWFCPNGKRR